VDIKPFYKYKIPYIILYMVFILFLYKVVFLTELMLLENMPIKKDTIIKTPKVYISYSWSSEDHQKWIIKLAEDLMANGVEVKLDLWDLKEGHDIYDFMESMVKDPEIDRVLVICDKGYFEKAETRKGGVGTETQIITPEIYTKTKQDKFIPILSERAEDGSPYVPTFVKGRLYIDLSSSETSSSEYEKLLRNLFSRPMHVKPELGKPPPHLFDNDATPTKTSKIIRNMRDFSRTNPRILRSLSKEFIQEFIHLLQTYRIKYSKESDISYDKLVLESIDKMLPIRDDFISFVEIYCSNKEELDPSLFEDFFEKLLEFTGPKRNETYTQLDFDNYRFLLWELFLYFVTILLHHKEFSLLAKILNKDFIFKQGHKVDNGRYVIFCYAIKSINDIRGKKLIERKNIVYDETKLVTTDLILYNLAPFNHTKWYPYVYLQNSMIDYDIELFSRLKSKGYCEKIMPLFGVDRIIDLKEMIETYEFEDKSFPFVTIPILKSFIDPREIGTLS